MDANRQVAADVSLYVALFGLFLALAAAVAEILAGIGTRWEWWGFRRGLTILRWAAYSGAGAAFLSLTGVFASWVRGSRRGVLLSATGLMIALIVTGIPWHFGQKAKRAPAIHDITTDVENPPQFVAILPLRKSAVNPVEYGGADIADKQRSAYPDIAPLELPLPPAQAFRRSLKAARSLGWEIAEAEEQKGRIEATDTTLWFGFKDDVVIRITAADGGSRVDVRSLSRVGKNDVGANAARIRRFLKKLRENA